MKYYEVNFTITPFAEDFCDILSAEIAEVGFETFVNKPDGLTAYCQKSIFDEVKLKNAIAQYPIPSIKISYKIDEAEDKDWNETWETEGYEPITIDDKLAISDPRRPSSQVAKINLTIRPCQAFGTGTHPTTNTLLRTLLGINLAGKKVVDAGCGTGILGILTSKLGAKSVLAYDIDEWSVNNTRENARANSVDNIITKEGDSSVLTGVCDIDLLIANIFREIIIADLPRFTSCLNKNGKMLISGFFTSDIEAIENAAAKMGFNVEKQCQCQEWAVLLLGRK